MTIADAIAKSFALAAGPDAGLARLVAKCGSEIPWAKDLDEAAARATKDRRLVVVVFELYSAFKVPQLAPPMLFMDPDVVELMQQHFVGLRWRPGMKAPISDAASRSTGSPGATRRRSSSRTTRRRPLSTMSRRRRRGPVDALALKRAGAGDAVNDSLAHYLKFLDATRKERTKALCHTGPEGTASYYLLYGARFAAEAAAGASAEIKRALVKDVLSFRCADGGFLDSPVEGRTYGTGMALIALGYAAT